jgi:hypothetical protein
MAGCEPRVLGAAVAEYEQFLQSCRDNVNGTDRYSMSAVVRACDSLNYNMGLWKDFPESRAAWACKLTSHLAITSARAIPGGYQIVSAQFKSSACVTNCIVQDSNAASESSGRMSAPILISSSSAEEDSKPYNEDENGADDVYDADSIIDESIRPVSVDHSNLSGNRLRVGIPCKHYLVKWSGCDKTLFTGAGEGSSKAPVSCAFAHYVHFAAVPRSSRARPRDGTYLPIACRYAHYPICRQPPGTTVELTVGTTVGQAVGSARIAPRATARGGLPLIRIDDS